MVLLFSERSTASQLIWNPEELVHIRTFTLLFACTKDHEHPSCFCRCLVWKTRTRGQFQCVLWLSEKDSREGVREHFLFSCHGVLVCFRDSNRRQGVLQHMMVMSKCALGCFGDVKITPYSVKEGSWAKAFVTAAGSARVYWLLVLCRPFLDRAWALHWQVSL